MPIRTHHSECSTFELYYDSDNEIYELPSIDNEGRYVAEDPNRTKLIHDFGDLIPPEPIPSTTDPTVQTISDLVTNSSILYGGFCFGGVTNKLPSVSDFTVDGFGLVQIPLVSDQVEGLLSLNNPRVTFNPTFSAGLDQLKAEVAKRIGYSQASFKLVFKKVIVHQTGVEVARQKDTDLAHDQFGTLFVLPPTKQTGVEMRVYHAVGVEGDQEKVVLKFGADTGPEISNWHYGFMSAEAEHEIARVTSGSRLMLAFGAVWDAKHQLKCPGQDHIGRIAAQLEMQSAKGDFLVAFLDRTYNNFENVGDRALNDEDRTLLRQLKAANNRLKEPFKVVLVSIVRNFYFKEHDNEKELEELHEKYNFESADVEWAFKECNILQQWFDLDGNPWPEQPNANLELMTNVLNPKKMSLKQLWGEYAMQEIQDIPSQGYNEFANYTYDATKTVTYMRSLLVLWPPELSIERVAEFDGWDVAFETLIGKSPVPATLTSLLQAFKDKKGCKDTKELLKDETICLIYDCITEKHMLDSLPVFIDVFFPTESVFKSIFLTPNEETWKITESTLLSGLDDSKAVHIVRLLEMAEQIQAPKERRYNLLQACLPKKLKNLDKKAVLRLVLPLADEDLVKILGEKFRTATYVLQNLLNALLMPEFAPLREEKFWSILAPALEQRIDLLKSAISKPFDKNHSDLAVIFPKESAQAKWLMQCPSLESECQLNVEDNDPKKGGPVVEQLKAYNLIFSAKLHAFYTGGVRIVLKKTEKFERHMQTLKGIKTELQTLIDMEKQPKEADNLEPPTKKLKLE